MDCDPIIKVGDLWTNQRKSMKGEDLLVDAPAIPCGLVAKSYFNDTYELWKMNADKSDVVGGQIEIVE